MEQTYLPSDARERIIDLMKEKSMTQQELAARTGMTVGTLSRFLCGKIDKLSADNVISIARIFQVSTDFLLGESDDRGRINYDIGELGLSVQAARNLYTGRVDSRVVNLLLENETDPVVWRGPVIAGAVKQFWTDVIWKDVDYMFVDMPPGTGDVPLTVFQSLPVSGIIVVTSPQELVSMIVEKAVKMAELMNVPVLGIVENMSYYQCPDCGAKHSIFGESHIEETARKFGIERISKIPVDPKLSAGVDAGMIELFEGDWLDDLADELEKKFE